MKPVAWALPSSHVFEGMRALMFQHQLNVHMPLTAAGLNLLYLAFGVAVFLAVFRRARMSGLLLHIGE
ncbi:MAG: hypothetical protein WCC36_14445 [Gammaproteobacteria bacterium]